MNETSEVFLIVSFFLYNSSKKKNCDTKIILITWPFFSEPLYLSGKNVTDSNETCQNQVGIKRQRGFTPAGSEVHATLTLRLCSVHVH